ncbi:hypothetical protein [Modicisalibacter luteus]|uniref:hypothetical protein n=1 Tax=Modicisalibacter luteus TaxID=453962 RepID=UPI00363BA881
MLSFFIFFMIFVGVTIALYQVYDVHYNLNFDDEEQRPRALSKELEILSEKANEYAETGSSPGFIQAVNRIFGNGFDYRIVLAALTGDRRQKYAEPLLRRKKYCLERLPKDPSFAVLEDKPAFKGLERCANHIHYRQ